MNKVMEIGNVKVKGGMYFIVPCLQRYGWEVVFFPKQPGKPSEYRYFLFYSDAETYIQEATKPLTQPARP